MRADKRWEGAHRLVGAPRRSAVATVKEEFSTPDSGIEQQPPKPSYLLHGIIIIIIIIITLIFSPNATRTTPNLVKRHNYLGLTYLTYMTCTLAFLSDNIRCLALFLMTVNHSG